MRIGRRHGWYGESYRHYLASKGVRTARPYMRWKAGPMVVRETEVVPAFLMWRKPSDDMLEAYEEVTARMHALNKRMMLLGSMKGVTQEDIRAYDEEMAKLDRMQKALLSLNIRELENLDELNPPTVPARVTSVMEEAERTYVPPPVVQRRVRIDAAAKEAAAAKMDALFAAAAAARLRGGPNASDRLAL